MFSFILLSPFRPLFIQVTDWRMKMLFSFLMILTPSMINIITWDGMAPGNVVYAATHKNTSSWQGSWRDTLRATPEPLILYSPYTLGNILICSGWLLVVSLLVRKMGGRDATEMPDDITTFAHLFQIWALCTLHTSLNVKLGPLVSIFVASFLRAMAAITLYFILRVLVMSPMVFMAHEFCFSTVLSSSRFISYWNKGITSISRGHLPPGQSQSFEIA